MTEISGHIRMLWCQGDVMKVGHLQQFLDRLGADADDELIVSVSPLGNAFTIEGSEGE